MSETLTQQWFNVKGEEGVESGVKRTFPEANRVIGLPKKG